MEKGTSVLRGGYGAGRQGSGSSLGEGCVSVLGRMCLMGEFIHRTHSQCEPLPQLGLVSSRSETLYFTIIKEQASRLLQGEGMFVSCAVSGGTRGPLLLKHTLSVVLCWCRFHSLSQREPVPLIQSVWQVGREVWVLPSSPRLAQRLALSGLLNWETLTHPSASGDHMLWLLSPLLFCCGFVFVVLDLKRKKPSFLLSVFGRKVKVHAHV